VVIEFVVPGEPIPWQRARRRGKRYFTDPKVAQYMDTVRWAWRAAGTIRLGAAPLRVEAVFHLTRPISHYRTGRNAHVLGPNAPAFPTGKPDLDNLLKILDALSGLAFDDDAQIISASIEKTYAPQGTAPFSWFMLTSQV
jgi:Holliday junction resolvase RusA-like endonuclease